MSDTPPFPRARRLAGCLPAYGGPGEDPEPPENGGTAAVSLALRGVAEGDPELLLIKRAQAGGDPWSGQMALPGGRRDQGDVSLLATAIRETREETGVDLPARESDDCRGFLGCLPPVAPVSSHLPAITIVPFVFGLPPGTIAEPRSVEVASTHWVRLQRFRDREARATIRLNHSGNEIRFPAVRTPSDDPVWGITYRIVMDLLERMEEEGGAGKPG